MHTLLTATVSAAVAVLAATTPVPETGSLDRQSATTMAQVVHVADKSPVLAVGDLADFGPLLSGLGF